MVSADALAAAQGVEDLPRLVSRGEITVRGRDEPLEIYALEEP